MSNSKVTSPTFIQGARDCVPTLLGYIGIGFAAGIVGNGAGLSLIENGLVAALVYAGASQFIISAMLIAASPAAAIIATTFIVNLRHLLMSAALAPHFRQGTLLNNIGIGALLTDESFGVATARLSKGLALNERWMNGLNLTAYLTWIASCIMGGWLGSWIQDPTQWGFDYALTAMFIALLIIQLHETDATKLKHYLKLILYMVIIMFVLCTFMTAYMAVLLSTIIVAAIGAITES